MGSGSAGVAALRNGRDFYGNDLCVEAVDITRRRLADVGGRELERTATIEHQPQLGLL